MTADLERLKAEVEGRRAFKPRPVYEALATMTTRPGWRALYHAPQRKRRASPRRDPFRRRLPPGATVSDAVDYTVGAAPDRYRWAEGLVVRELRRRLGREFVRWERVEPPR